MKRSSMGQNLEQHSSTDEQLLPGISNEITLHKISKKLPWNTFHTLTSVSRAWRAAVRSREMFDARIRSHSTDTLVVISYVNRLSASGGFVCTPCKHKRVIGSLPPINYWGGIPFSSKCVTLDGKIYILGGWYGLGHLVPPSSTKKLCWSKRVFMFDVAGQGGWKSCASMQASREDFACAAINGKIYVCGGTSCSGPHRGPVCEMEVYDPQTDKSTTIMPMPFGPKCHDVGIIGDELLLYGGLVYDENPDEKKYLRQVVVNGEFRTPRLKYVSLSGDRLEVYNTKEDEWRKEVLKSDPAWTGRELFFIAEGRLHSIDKSTIFVFDAEKHTKTRLQSSLLPRFSPRENPMPITVVAADHEL
ncbi:unnamed protein product [Calypogeia fissa]